MLARINVLPKSVADLIAAGEVVERPASVVKELVENSIDAGATAVTVEIKNGGITYIRITDNGCGIFSDDVPKAFLSHATSKVSAADDLDSIFTLGFRGEALASVAAVAHVEMLTKSSDEPYGTSYIIEGGEQLSHDAAGCPDGTTIVVRDLFYNTPARMKFLKKDVSEANAVAGVIDKLALSHPEISFRFIREGKRVLLTPGDSRLLSAVYSVFGKNFADSLIETEYELDGVKVSGLISKPELSRASRSMQHFFLNGRYIKSAACCASLENAYRNSIMIGKFPACVLNINVSPNLVDVNVHPAKTEVRFSDEKRIYSAVYYAVKSALEHTDSKPRLSLDKIVKKAVPTATQLHISDEISREKQKYPADETEPSSLHRSDFAAVASPVTENKHIFQSDEPDLTSGFASKLKSRPEAVAAVSHHEAAVSDRSQPQTPASNPEISIRIIGEAFKTYIICEFEGKLCIIDKHAAHERIIFNRLKHSSDSSVSQVLLAPVTVLMSKTEYDAVFDNLAVFSACGFVVDDFGRGTVIVRECPMMIDPADVEDTVCEIAANLASGKTDVQTEKIDAALHMTACKAAIKAGNNQSLSELSSLAYQVLTDDSVRFCPHGRPVLIELTEYELKKQFGRIQ